jgi:hypothetical protein
MKCPAYRNPTKKLSNEYFHQVNFGAMVLNEIIGADVQMFFSAQKIKILDEEDKVINLKTYES